MQVKQRAVKLANAMENEDGVTGAVKAFYKHFPRDKNKNNNEVIEPKPPRTKSYKAFRQCFGCSWFFWVQIVVIFVQFDHVQD